MENTILIADMICDCNNIYEDYNFCNLHVAHTRSYISRDKILGWLDWLWKFISEKHLHETYKELLSGIHILKGC